MSLKEQYELLKSSLPIPSCWIENEDFALYDEWMDEQVFNDFESTIDSATRISNSIFSDLSAKSIIDNYKYVAVFLRADSKNSRFWYEIVGGNQDNPIEQWEQMLRLKAFI